jgi:hypothetical protein
MITLRSVKGKICYVYNDVNMLCDELVGEFVGICYVMNLFIFMLECTLIRCVSMSDNRRCLTLTHDYIELSPFLKLLSVLSCRCLCLYFIVNLLVKLCLLLGVR